MKRYHIVTLLFIWTITTATDCGREEYEQKRSRIYVKGIFSNTNDTMYVGDTLTLTITIPDSSFKINEFPPFDTTWIKVENFSDKSGEFSLYRIDTNEIGNVNNFNPKWIKQLKGVNYQYTNYYPFVIQIEYYLNEKGSYFFQSAYDIIPKINGIYGSMILEWDVPNKNFEILRAWGEQRYKSAIAGDAVDANNYFPFVVKER